MSKGRKVQFKFSLDEKVMTRFGAVGNVTMLAVDDGGIKYYVETEKKDSWEKEVNLTRV